MDQLRAMKVFVRVIDEGGFAKAARALDMAPPVVTRVVAELESRLGARLLNRTTRRIALTDVGESYLDRVRQILIDVDEAVALAGESTREARGHVRVLAPPAVSVHQLAKHLPRFRLAYPQVSLEIVASGGIETVDEDFDITILATRNPIEGEFIARRLARSEVVMCASPEYLNARGRPQHPRELEHHEVLIPPILSIQRGITFFTGVEPGGESYTTGPARSAALRTTHVDTNYAATLAGLGIGGLPSLVIEDALVEGALERVFPAWHLFSVTLWAAIPSRKHMPVRTRALLDFLIQTFGGEDRDPWLAAAGCETAPRANGATPGAALHQQG